MRVRTFSSVLLPAPLRPMMPMTCPASTSKLTSVQGPHVAHVTRRGAGVAQATDGAVAALVMASRSVFARLLRGADHVPLAEAGDADRGAHTRSAKTRSMRLK